MENVFAALMPFTVLWFENWLCSFCFFDSLAGLRTELQVFQTGLALFLSFVVVTAF